MHDWWSHVKVYVKLTDGELTIVIYDTFIREFGTHIGNDIVPSLSTFQDHGSDINDQSVTNDDYDMPGWGYEGYLFPWAAARSSLLLELGTGFVGNKNIVFCLPLIHFPNYADIWQIIMYIR